MRIGESSSAGLQSAKKTSGTRGHCCSPPGSPNATVTHSWADCASLRPSRVRLSLHAGFGGLDTSSDALPGWALVHMHVCVCVSARALLRVCMGGENAGACACAGA
eukprot:7866353-Alexandrium_andersonii.AAC.1